MSSRTIFEAEHDCFREMVGAFLDREVVPFHPDWERDGVVDRRVWERAGEQGLLGLQLEEELGGGGTPDFRFNVVIDEEMAKRGTYGAAFNLFNDMIAPYLIASTNQEQRERWFPGLTSGALIAAIAMTEPGAGSDLQGITTSAVLDGDEFVLNGQKTFISNGILADLVIVVARTDPGKGSRSFSLLVVERGMPGFTRGRNLAKVGQHAQDTAELFFENVRVPKANLLGERGAGFSYLMTNLAKERLSIAVTAATNCEVALQQALDYARQRTAFGQPIGGFQHNRFLLAELATEVHIARVFVDDCIRLAGLGELTSSVASMAKWWTTELNQRVVDRAVQLHGGNGYMVEYPIAQSYLNCRIQTIAGGTTEIQKEVIGRALGL